jgi:hypothetical protein
VAGVEWRKCGWRGFPRPRPPRRSHNAQTPPAGYSTPADPPPEDGGQKVKHPVFEGPTRATTCKTRRAGLRRGPGAGGADDTEGRPHAMIAAMDGPEGK